jgi:hypothetical protein
MPWSLSASGVRFCVQCRQSRIPATVPNMAHSAVTSPELESLSDGQLQRCCASMGLPCDLPRAHSLSLLRARQVPVEVLSGNQLNAILAKTYLHQSPRYTKKHGRRILLVSRRTWSRVSPCEPRARTLSRGLKSPCRGPTPRQLSFISPLRGPSSPSRGFQASSRGRTLFQPPIPPASPERSSPPRPEPARRVSLITSPAPSYADAVRGRKRARSRDASPSPARVRMRFNEDAPEGDTASMLPPGVRMTISFSVQPSPKPPGGTSKAVKSYRKRCARRKARKRRILLRHPPPEAPPVYLGDLQSSFSWLQPGASSSWVRRCILQAAREWPDEHWSQFPFRDYFLSSDRRMLVFVSIDHIRPRGLGGMDHPENFAVVPEHINWGFGDYFSTEKQQYYGAAIISKVAALHKRYRLLQEASGVMAQFLNSEKQRA